MHDERWLLENELVPQEVLSRALRSPEPLIVHAAVLQLQRRWLLGLDPPGLLGLLPDPFSLPPETQRVVVGWLLQGARLPGFAKALPPADLPPLLRISWLRAALLENPALLSKCERTPLGVEAIRELPVEPTTARGLLPRLVESGQPATRAAAVRLVGEAIERGLLAPETAQDFLVLLARDPGCGAEALRLLARPWACLLPCPSLVLGSLGDAQRELAAIAVLQARHEVDPLRRALAIGRLEPRVLREALRALGHVGTERDLRTILEVTAGDPLYFAEAALEALRSLKRRGFSLGVDEAPAVVDLFLESQELSPEAVAEVLSSRADTLVAGLDVDDRGHRAVSLLEALGTRSAVERLCAIVDRPAERRWWREAILALGRLEALEAEEAVLTRLDDEPDACLTALAQVGGSATVRRLRERLLADGELPPWAARAAQVLFGLDPAWEIAERCERLGLLSPQVLSAMPAHAGAAQTEGLAALSRQVGHPLRLEAIAGLGRTGGPLALEPLAWLLDDADEDVRTAAIRALRLLGERLARLGAVRPACLRGERPAELLLAEAVLRRLRDRSALSVERLSRLLDALAGLDHPRLARTVRRLLRHGSAEVRKRAIACLATAGAQASAWLLPSLEDEELPVARQALLALGSLRASWLCEPVARWLDQPNMNLKKTAAEVLARAGAPRAVPRLLAWLSVHDNPGFRSLLAAALSGILGEAYPAVVLSRLQETTDPRARGLLVDALSGKLSPAGVAAIVACRVSGPADRPEWLGQLVRQVYVGKLELATGQPVDLDGELRRRGLEAWVLVAPGEDAGLDLEEREGLRRLEGARATLALGALLSKARSPADDRAIAGLLLRPSAWRAGGLPRAEARRLMHLLPSLDPEAIDSAVELLSGDLSDPLVAFAVARALAGREREKVPGRLAHLAADAWSQDAARFWLSSSEKQARTKAAQVLILEASVPAWPAAEARTLLGRFVLEDRADDAFAYCLESGPGLEDLVVELVRQEGPARALARVKRWLEERPDLQSTLVSALETIGEEGQDELRRLALSARIDLGLRVRILEGLDGARGKAHRDLLRALLEDPTAPLRRESARQLFRTGFASDRLDVLEAWVAGGLGDELDLALEPGDFLFFEERRGTPSAPAVLRRTVQALAHLAHPQRVPMLLELWRSEHPEVREAARDALREQPFDEVLAHLEPLLAKREWAALAVLPRVSTPGPRLEALFAQAPDDVEEWSRFLLGSPAGQAIHAPLLATCLAQAVAESPSARQAVARLTDWSDAARASRLVKLLEPALRGPGRPGLVEAIAAALQGEAPERRAEVLGQIAHPAEEVAVLALADAVLEAPSAAERLPRELRRAASAALDAQALGHDPERVRRILTVKCRAARDPADRAALTELLERAIGHHAGRVRLHALRLLREHADRERYLGASRRLLRDPDPAVVRSAIRILAFGKVADAGEEIAAHLASHHPAVQRAAREGLLVLGREATGPLQRAITKARPDRRAALTEILQEIADGKEP